MYSWDLTNLATVTLEEGTTTSALANLTDNDLATVFTSDNDEVKVIIEFPDSTVVKHLALNNVLRLGSFKLEAYDETAEDWKPVNKTSYDNLFADGALWHNLSMGDKESYKKYRLTLYKAPGALQIEVADVLMIGYYYTKDIVVNGTNTFFYMADDIKTSGEGSFISCTTPSDAYGGYPAGSFGTLDNARGSKFSVKAKTFQLVYEFNTSAKLNSFLIANATTSGRDARTFEIQGSNTNTDDYVTLYRIENLDWKGRNYMFGGNFSNDQYYKYYRFDMQANNGDGSYSEIGDLLYFGKLYGEDTGIGKKIASDITVFSSGNNIVIENATTDAVSYQIIDLTGRTVKQGIASGNKTDVSVTGGMYIVRLTDASGKIFTNKVIVK
jgi:hypothetical protein